MNAFKEKAIRVLIVEDSRSVAEFLTQMLDADPGIQVVGTASNGYEALEAVKKMKPQVITMDVHMPGMNGFEATRSIMECCPTPIVIVSGSVSQGEVAINFQALEAGALAVVAAPYGVGHLHHDRSVEDLVNTVKLMSEVKVVRRWRQSLQSPFAADRPVGVTPAGSPLQVVAIGASTGGPISLQAIFSRLPKNFPVPVLVVQHMTPGFTAGFVKWLALSSGIPVHLATRGESILPGHAYVAPDDFHMGLGTDRRITLDRSVREHGMRPAASFLFRSIEAVFGSKAVGVLLTGMGVDGAEELKHLKNAGAITFAQDEESSVVYGMPGQAKKIGAATHILPPERIAQALITLMTKL
jgi:two-component system, chemotaxis family, protein-glutamate methylesterase/glutaminase